MELSKYKKITITNLIVLVNIIVFIITDRFSILSEDPEWLLRFGAMEVSHIIDSHEYYRLFTANFLHFGIEHLGSNMVLLFLIGNLIEESVGKIRFSLIYIIGGILANIPSLVYNMIDAQEVVSAGASGAIFALCGALFWITLRYPNLQKEVTLPRVIIFSFLSLASGFYTEGIDNFAHLGGFVFGFILAMILIHPKNYRKGKAVYDEN
ncbi:MAG: rhomboid family intramembrane serine protease [Lachnospiraceae bacterium]|nr:rhomboid family intramembrane serine protease [Lachnospiraceae bacterium]